MSKTYATPAWVASGVWAQDVLLPTDYNIRKLVLRGYLAANYVQNVINHVKISEDNDKKIPIDHDVSTLQKLLNLLQDEYSETLSINLTSGGLAVYCAPSYNLRIAGMALAADKTAYLALVNPKIPVTLTTSTNVAGQYEIVGNLPHSTIMLPFGDQDDMTDWYDTSKVGKLALLPAQDGNKWQPGLLLCVMPLQVEPIDPIVEGRAVDTVISAGNQNDRDKRGVLDEAV